MQIDDLDLLLFEELKADARQPVLTLARKLGLKRSTIRYRLDRLISEGILRIVCKSDPKLLGYNCFIIIGIRTRPEKTMAVADHLASLPAVKHICLTAGRFNIMAFAFYRDESEIANFLSKDLTDISDVSYIEIMHVIQRLKSFFQNNEATFTGGIPPEMSDLDLSIISAIQQDPRQTLTKLAKTTGCSQAVAKNKLNQLINDGIIELLTIIDPTVFEPVKWSLILIRPELGKLNAVTDTLSSRNTIVDLSLITGQWQILAVANLQEEAHMHYSLLDTPETVTGVKEFEIMPLLKTVKFSIMFI